MDSAQNQEHLVTVRAVEEQRTVTDETNCPGEERTLTEVIVSVKVRTILHRTFYQLNMMIFL